ncbi:hypothetical protein [Variovorax sp. ZT4R33]|uniref:hypothetical protein n=1 Tax=Variovorax sp. ZT4R33 TaxID=3443743 RepID=UPI003F458E61
MSIWSTRKHAAWVGAILLSLTVGGAFGLSLASHSSSAPSSVLAQHAPVAKRPTATSAMLDGLRQGSLLGNEAVSGDLATLLLDRYDLNGDNDDLFEAVVWIDRDLYAASNLTLAKRISSHYCNHRVLQWHALCILGE